MYKTNEAKKLSCQIGLNNLFDRIEASNIPLQLFANRKKYWAVKLYMTIVDKFRLLEYIELKEARRSSLIAQWFAFVAITVSIISTLVQIYLK